ncbi:acyl-CoA desaturase [Anaerobacillus alkalidiazotrophicus]|uniref:Acyl-CoA desaturase n=1 Tax=Anaerobacillus alkalidiazotrophicus TaxID=472963 RepID=A0A1S2MA65_9BACI|nr:acyl-CoA desaturase [Anaerobacillus alkalidiazotrophicus]OIJ21393.1 acyl-CoA desaturase [Anaerobacillus alkalidiazotrophicus]
MNDLKTFGWYAARISPELPKEAFKPVPTRLFGGIAYLITVITGMLLISQIQLPIIVNLFISIIIGFSFSAMGFLGHEILHGTVIRNPRIRNLLGAIFFWPLCTGPRLWRKWHNMEHHVHTQDETKDPDAWPSANKFSKNWIVRLVYKLPLQVRSIFGFLYLAISFSIHSINMFFLYFKEFNMKNRSAVFIQLVLPWMFWIGLLFIIGPVAWFFAYLLPLFIANSIVMGYISTNHRLNPLVDVNDPLANCLTVTVPKWVDVLHFNFSYHTEHHLFPAMNPKYYPLVKDLILQKWPERYHQMPFARALLTLYKTPRVYHEKNELLDPHDKKVYSTLGNGLNVKEIQYRKL